MRVRVTVLGFLALLVSLVPSTVYAQSQIKLFVTLIDDTGKPTETLDPATVRVLENGAECKVVKIEPINGKPKIQMLVDNGLGLGQDNLTFLRDGLRKAIKAFPPDVEVAIYTTAPQPRPLIASTADRAALEQAIGRLSYDGGFGRMTESISEAAQRMAKEKGDSMTTLLVVGSDGGNPTIAPGIMNPMVDRLLKSHATVHVVMLSSATQGGGVEPESGSAIAKMTGGRYEAIVNASRLTSLLGEIGAQIAKQVTSGGGGNFRVTVDRPKGASGPIGKLSFGAGSKISVKIIQEQ